MLECFTSRGILEGAIMDQRDLASGFDIGIPVVIVGLGKGGGGEGTRVNGV